MCQEGLSKQRLTYLSSLNYATSEGQCPRQIQCILSTASRSSGAKLLDMWKCGKTDVWFFLFCFYFNLFVQFKINTCIN